MCKVNAENYSDNASSAPQQNKKVLSPCFQYTNSVKQKIVHCTPWGEGGGGREEGEGGGGRGRGQSLFKVRGPTIRFLPRLVQQLKCYLEWTQNFIFGTLERTLRGHPSPSCTPEQNETFLGAACHAFRLHVRAWEKPKRLV